MSTTNTDEHPDLMPHINNKTALTTEPPFSFQRGRAEQGDSLILLDKNQH